MEIDNLSFSVPWSRNSYETELKNKFAKYIVVLNKETNKVLGFAGMWLIIDECHITNIAVHPNHRGLGIGNILMNEIIDICKEHNLTSITLEVRESNTAAKIFIINMDLKIAVYEKAITQITMKTHY